MALANRINRPTITCAFSTQKRHEYRLVSHYSWRIPISSEATDHHIQNHTYIHANKSKTPARVQTIILKAHTAVSMQPHSSCSIHTQYSSSKPTPLDNHRTSSSIHTAIPVLFLVTFGKLRTVVPPSPYLLLPCPSCQHCSRPAVQLHSDD